MMEHAGLLIVYCLLIIASSIAGGLVPLWVRLTHTRLQVTISLTAGIMLGVAVLHMIPHSIAGRTEAQAGAAMVWLLIGFLAMFFIERFFSFHTHEVAVLDSAGQVVTEAVEMSEHNHGGHVHSAEAHAHAHGMVGDTPGNKLSWTGAAVGMTLHSIIGGVALASAVAASPVDHELGLTALAGFAVFMVIVLHKPLDALTVITLTASAGFSKPTRHLINAVFSLAVPLGVVLFAVGLNQTTLAASGTLVNHALAFSAGTFLCIALSDLLPELHFHSHDRVKLSAALILGVVLAYMIAVAEHSMHDHAPGIHDHAPRLIDDHQTPDDHDGHDH